jgi:Holliday junction DNA helicase RuvA
MQRQVESGGDVKALPALAPAESDAVAALVKLGYSQVVAAEAVARAAQSMGPNADSLPLDALIREALRQLARLS